jgi:two-component system KDP operon response regulator KdpE
MTRVLIVDDEPQITRALRVNLLARSFEVISAATGKQALDAASHHHPDVVVLDLGLPDMDGIDVIRGLRGWSTVPILILSGRLESNQKIQALDAGADDYVTKPFHVEELLARVRAVTRRAVSVKEEPLVHLGQVTVDRTDHRVTRASPEGNLEIRLTPTEWTLLEFLARYPGRLITQRELAQGIRGPDLSDSAHYLRQYMAQLRRKLEENPSRPRYLLTEPGMGYRLQPDEPGPETPEDQR